MKHDFFTCHVCGGVHPIEDVHVVYDANGVAVNVCSSCFEDECSACWDCGEMHLNSALRSLADYDYCPSCYESHRRDTRRCSVRSYHNNPVWNACRIGSEPVRRLIGFELETDSPKKDFVPIPTDYLRRVQIVNRYGDGERILYQMRDGSLSNAEGIEIISQPMTKKFFDAFNFESLFSELKIAGARSHDTSTCGLHIHLSRAWFGNSKAERNAVIGLCYYFCFLHGYEIERFARRNGNEFAAYPYQTQWFSSRRRRDLDYAYECSQSSDWNGFIRNLSYIPYDYYTRYDCINCKQRSTTIEFRMFRGTLNPETFRLTIDFVLRMVEYARWCYKNKHHECSWSKFLTFKPMPAAMHDYMVARGCY